MTTGATGQLGLALPVQGELSGTWGDTVNNGLTQYINIAIAGTLTLTNDGAVTLANTTGDASASNVTSTLTGAGTVTAQFAIVRVTGTLTVAKVVTGPSYSKTYTVVNAATGGIVTFKAAGQTGVSVAVGESAFVYFNGTDYVKIVGTATAGAAGGSTTQVQYNNAGVLAGITGATTNGTALTLVAPNLGSPASVGTMPAFTLGGTVSGGGNQINNVIIGTSTPLAGTFTQLDITAQGTLRLQDTTGGEYVALRAPSSLAGNYTLTFPADDGTSGQALITDGSGVLSWSTAASGDVYGPGSSTDNAVARFDSTTGKLLQNSVVIVGDTGDVSGVAALSASGAVTLSGGTANGVTYLNGSKVLTSGSALTFDGTNLSSTGGATFEGGPTAYGGGEIRLGSTSASLQNAISTQGTGTPQIIFDHRGTSNTGTFTWRNGTGGANTLLFLGATGNMQLNTTTNKTTAFSGNGSGLTIGAALAPTLALYDTTNTTYVFNLTQIEADSYLYNTANGVIAFGTNNTERMRLNATGNLGIGTSSPAYKLDVNTTADSFFNGIQVRNLSAGSSATSSYALGQDTNATAASIFINSSTNTNFGGANSLNIYQGLTAPLVFYTAATARMRISSAGDVGIGTSSPASKLHIVDALSGGQLLVASNETNATSKFGTFATQHYTNAEEPAVALVVESNATDNLISIGGVLGEFNAATQVRFFTAANNTTVTGTERMRLDSVGNLGLGVTPSAWGTSNSVKAFQLPGVSIWGFNSVNAYFSANSYYNGTNRIYINTNFATEYAQTAGQHQWYTAASGTAGNTITFTQAMTLDADGDLGIGTTSPAVKLHVASSSSTTFSRIDSSAYRIYVGAESDGNAIYSQTLAGSDALLRFYTASTERMRLDASGNLGLGVTPSAWSSLKAIQIGSGGALSGDTGAGYRARLSANTYYDGSSFRYIASVAASLYTLNGNTGSHIWSVAGSGTAGNVISFTDSMTLDSSGNLGVGTTSPFTRLEVNSGSGTAPVLSVYATNPAYGAGDVLSTIGFGANASGNNIQSASISGLNETASSSTNGILRFSTRTAGSVTEKMRITSAGNAGLGTLAPGNAAGYSTFSVNGSSGGQITFQTAQAEKAYIYNDSTDLYLGTVSGGGAVRLYANSATERARIDSSGNLLVGTTSSSGKLAVVGTANSTTCFVQNTNASPDGSNTLIDASYIPATPNNTTTRFFIGRDNTAVRIELRSNGGIANYTANDVNLSDIRTKTDIQDAGGYLAKICAIPVRTFKYKDQTDGLLNLGVIAQEVEAVAPELVDTTGFGETPDDGVPLKAIYQTDLQYALMKCIQEQQAIIESLKARLDAANL